MKRTLTTVYFVYITMKCRATEHFTKDGNKSFDDIVIMLNCL